MGALVNTRGTRHLVNHYNTIFGVAKFPTTRTTILNDRFLSNTFQRPTGTAIRDIINHNAGLFLPSNTNHPNLLARWDFFLRNEFVGNNHILLAGFIWNALNNTNRFADPYTAIYFDCVEASAGQQQAVLQSDEYKLNNNDQDDKKMDKAAAYSKIVLVTAPTNNIVTPLDPQF
jgi:hypothetical protein